MTPSNTATKADNPPEAATSPASRGGITLLRFLAASLIALISSPLAAQEPATRTLTGVVTANDGSTPLPAVQVVATRESNPSSALSASTDATGRFTIASVAPGRYVIRLVRLGFAPDTQTVTVAEDSPAAVDLGTISLTPVVLQLDDVSIVAEQPAVIQAPDRDIYLAEAVPGAAGGSATDVLQGIPDLEVDIDGGVRMMGETPAIYINGRPAPMTGESLALFLEQFAAENIQNIEVLPNPSARYNAEGSGGIVNIVLKEDVGLGISGNAFVSGGTNGRFRGGTRATWQRGPLTLNGGASMGMSEDERTSDVLRQNLLVDPVTFLRQAGRTDRSSRNGNVDLGARYDLGRNTRLNAEARVDRRVSDADRVTRYTSMDADRSVTEEYDRLLNDDATATSLDLALELRHQFRRDDASASDDGRGGWGRGRSRWDRSDEFRIEVEYERGSDMDRSLVERRILESFGEVDFADEVTWEEDRETSEEVTVGFDFARSIGESSEIEFGYESEFGWTDEGRQLEERLPDGTIGELNRGFLHRQNIHGGYLTLSRQFGDFGAQVGVRGEYSDNRLELSGDEPAYENSRFHAFPSANLNYSFGNGKRVRLSYSVRVRRPSSNVLNPINTSSDPLNRRIGNPSIAPQYTHSYTLNASWSGEMGSLRASPFLRRSTNQWEQLRTVDGDGVATTTYDNLGSTTSYGMSLTASLRDVYDFRGRITLSGQRTDRNYAAVLDRATPSSTRWSIRTNLDRQLGSALSAQMSLTYNPARDLPQGRASSTIMTQLGMRYRFLDRRASLSMNVTDPFDIYDSSVQRSDRGFVEFGNERRSMRRLTMSLSYSFQAGGGVRRSGR